MAEKTRAEELHDEYRRKIWDDSKSGTENFDKYMLTFSSGALGLSLAFIKDVAPIGSAVWVPSLISSWIAFLLCIVVTLVSFRISIRALEKMGPCIDAFYLKGDEKAFNKHLQSLWTSAVDWCAYAAIIFFVTGVIFTMMFVGANIREAKRMSREDNPKRASLTEIIKKSAGKTMYVGDALKPVAMTPITNEDRGIKPAVMTPMPAQTPTPNVPAPKPTQTPKKR